MSKKPFWKKESSLGVLAFIIVTALLLGYCEQADAEWGVDWQHDSTAGISSFNHGYDRLCVRYYFPNASMYGCPLVAVGGNVESGGELGLSDELFPRWEGELRLSYFDDEMYGGATFARVIGDGPFQTRLGLTYWLTESPGSNSDVTFSLTLRYAW